MPPGVLVCTTRKLQDRQIQAMQTHVQSSLLGLSHINEVLDRCRCLSLLRSSEQNKIEQAKRSAAEREMAFSGLRAMSRGSFSLKALAVVVL